ncbi:hypothetical protein N7539_006759 [Penicillium diatomitis]|uniref:Uncharacterized protein n=1 Tax=Penicillium diatomitis TaxID=2819901 RepID=A0A9W9X269_9EURO|nr:uncharacterized protein N7539_006759 [Penicillium diatomitis]KAJ5480865.1 hypothetical protein N7539_006759 [Penicillium diatomitis]
MSASTFFINCLRLSVRKLTCYLPAKVLKPEIRAASSYNPFGCTPREEWQGWAREWDFDKTLRVLEDNAILSQLQLTLCCHVPDKSHIWDDLESPGRWSQFYLAVHAKRLRGMQEDGLKDFSIMLLKNDGWCEYSRPSENPDSEDRL